MPSSQASGSLSGQIDAIVQASTNTAGGEHVPVEQGPRELNELLDAASVPKQADETYTATTYASLPDAFADHAQAAIPQSADEHNQLVAQMHDELYNNNVQRTGNWLSTPVVTGHIDSTLTPQWDNWDAESVTSSEAVLKAREVVDRVRDELSLDATLGIADEENKPVEEPKQIESVVPERIEDVVPEKIKHAKVAVLMSKSVKAPNGEEILYATDHWRDDRVKLTYVYHPAFELSLQNML